MVCLHAIPDFFRVFKVIETLVACKTIDQVIKVPKQPWSCNQFLVSFGRWMVVI